MRIFSPVASSVKSTSAPRDLPIQLRCMVSTRSGHPLSFSMSSSSRSA